MSSENTHAVLYISLFRAAWKKLFVSLESASSSVRGQLCLYCLSLLKTKQ